MGSTGSSTTLKRSLSIHNIQRVRNLNGGIAVQNRLAFQCEHFVAKYGEEAATQAPPVRRMMDMCIPVGAGTDATKVSSYNPWLSLYWLITGKSVGGAPSFSESLVESSAYRLSGSIVREAPGSQMRMTGRER